MIVVVACDVPLTPNNGTAVAALNLIHALRACGDTVRILCPDAALSDAPDTYITKPLNLGPLNAYVRKNDVLLSRRCRSIVRRALEGADELHTITPFALCHTAILEARRRGIPVSAGFHCQAENFSTHVFLMNSTRFNRLLYRFFDRTIYRYAAKIHYPTQFIRDTFETAIGHTTPGEIISNGVGAEFTPGKTDPPQAYQDNLILLFTGRYSKEKSHRVLIDAVTQSKYADRIRLIFAGDGPLRDKLEAYAAKKLKLPPLFGFHTRQELIEIIHYADLYIHPAEIEIEAIACLEAIRCGLVPIIADSPRSATRFFALDEKNLFPCNNASALASRIDYWLDHPDEKKKRSEDYLGFTEKYEKARCMERMTAMIHELGSRKK